MYIYIYTYVTYICICSDYLLTYSFIYLFMNECIYLFSAHGNQPHHIGVASCSSCKRCSSEIAAATKEACHAWKSPQIILWMEECLHQLVDGLSRYNPIIYSASLLPIVSKWCRISFIHSITIYWRHSIWSFWEKSCGASLVYYSLSPVAACVEPSVDYGGKRTLMQRFFSHNHW